MNAWPIFCTCWIIEGDQTFYPHKISEQSLSEIVVFNSDLVAISVTTPHEPIIADVVSEPVNDLDIIPLPA